MQKVNIPKDRDGKQRSFGFVTYKHVSSVPYAIDLFDGTTLFNRAISLKSRNNTETAHTLSEQSLPLNDLIQLGNQMLLGNCMPQLHAPFDIPYSMQIPNMHSNQFLGSSFPSYNEDRRSHRSHPYNREQDRGRHNSRYNSDNNGRYNNDSHGRHNNDYGRDNRREQSSYREKHRDSSHRSNKHANRRNHRS